MIELTLQSIELWDLEHASGKKKDARQHEANNPSDPKTLDGE